MSFGLLMWKVLFMLFILRRTEDCFSPDKTSGLVAPDLERMLFHEGVTIEIRCDLFIEWFLVYRELFFVEVPVKASASKGFAD